MDGAARTDDNGAASPHYEPSSNPAALHTNPADTESRLNLGDAVQVGHFDHRVDTDYYSQAGDLFRLMNQDQQTLLINNIAKAMYGVDSETQKRQIEHFKKADPAYAEGIKKTLEI